MRPAPSAGRPPREDPDVSETVYDMDKALFEQRCLQAYARGQSVTEIARTEDVDRGTIYLVIKQAAESAREGNREYAEQAFVQQDLGLKLLIRRAHDAVEHAANDSPPRFDKDAVRVLILLYERQSKLLGIDRARAFGERDRNEWLQTASDQELLKRAKALGIRVPDSIVSAAGHS